MLSSNLPARSEPFKYCRDVDVEPMDVSDSEEQAGPQEQTGEEQAAVLERQAEANKACGKNFQPIIQALPCELSLLQH